MLTPGDYVRMIRKGSNKLNRTIWVVESVRESPKSQSGYVCDVYAKNDTSRKMWDYDCEWYVKIS